MNQKALRQMKKHLTNDGTPPQKIILNYPVVLVHGIVARERKDYTKFWGRIPKILTGMGIQVFFGNTYAWDDYESNAHVLKETIEKILLETGKEKVNIIAHSKGGLDSRYLIWKYDFGSKIASLTTIGTPHRGSEIADLIHKQTMKHTKTSLKALLLYGKLCSDITPALHNVNHQLTTTKMKEFNEKIIMDERVDYHSLYTTMKNPFNDVLFFHTYSHIKKTSGENDGLASEASVKWGANITRIKGGISHREILDLRKRKVSGRDIPGVYIEIVKGLSEKGF